MTTFFHPSLPALVHQELIVQRQADRHLAAARRQNKAQRLDRRAASLRRRAAALLADSDR